MERVFKLEYSEKQQCFHHNYGNDPKSDDWPVIFEHCTKLENAFFRSYIEAHLQKPYKYSQLMDAADKVRLMLKYFLERGGTIQSATERP